MGSSSVYLGDSGIPNAGRGVFAAREIKQGEVIEICPVVTMSRDSVQHLDKTELENYYFEWGIEGDQAGIALGYGSLYNHSFKPNAVFEINILESVVCVTAISDIPKDVEITFNYNGDPEDQSPLWIKGIN